MVGEFPAALYLIIFLSVHIHMHVHNYKHQENVNRLYSCITNVYINLQIVGGILYEYMH